VSNALSKRLAALVYYLAASKLPDYGFPFGDVWRLTRAACVRRMFVYAGDWVNVEGNVFIADGRWIAIGDGSSLGHGSRVYGVTMGDNVMVGPNCTFLKDNHVFADVTRPMRGQGLSAPTCPVIEDDVWIGEKVVILPGIRVGTGSIVGAGSVVTKDVPPFTIVAGNPARQIRTRG
jgi:maltose O-acetyltransferase